MVIFIRLCGFKVIWLCGIYRNLRKSEATVNLKTLKPKKLKLAKLQPYNLKTEEVEAFETSVLDYQHRQYK